MKCPLGEGIAIGFDAETAGTATVHGAPLESDGTDFMKKATNGKKKFFFVSEEVYNQFNADIVEND